MKNRKLAELGSLDKEESKSRMPETQEFRENSQKNFLQKRKLNEKREN
jgi:hypothetical protein